MEFSSISDQNGRSRGNYSTVTTEARVLEKLEGGDHAKGGVVLAVEGDENLKNKIMEHPLYDLLLKRHLDCLKVSLGEFGEADETEGSKGTNSELINRDPDLDLFMETYCVTLSKLKEAMEVPLQETASFIKAMHDQLEELRDTHCC